MHASLRSTCTGVVLAGGASARFGGAPKGLHVVGGRRVLDRVLDALRATTEAQLIVANDPSAPEWAPGVPVVRDLLATRGSLVGIHAALAHCGTPVLVVAWDMPFVTPALLDALRRRGEAAEGAVVPRGPRGIEPCCAYYVPDDARVAARQIDAGELRLSDFLAALPQVSMIEGVELAAVGDPERLFLNVNDAADLADAERLAARTSS